MKRRKIVLNTFVAVVLMFSMYMFVDCIKVKANVYNGSNTYLYEMNIDNPKTITEIVNDIKLEAVYDEESAKIRLKKSFYKIVEGLEQKGVQIIQKDVKIIRKTDGLKLTGTITVWEEAVLLSPAMPVEEQKTSEDGDA
jgi:hypothetical protein